MKAQSNLENKMSNFTKMVVVAVLTILLGLLMLHLELVLPFGAVNLLGGMVINHYMDRYIKYEHARPAAG